MASSFEKVFWGTAAAGLVVVGANKLDIDINPFDNMFDGAGEELADIGDAVLGNVGNAIDPVVPEPTLPYSSSVEGGVIDIQITPQEWPLFKRIVELDPLQITRGSDIEYEQESAHIVKTSMIGRIAFIKLGTPSDSEVYVMAVDDNNTSSQTDDRLVPIDFENFVMESSVVAGSKTFAAGNLDLEREYRDCRVQLGKYAEGFGECTLSGTNGYSEPIVPEVLSNVRDQYIGLDKCAVDTLTISSNAVSAGDKQVTIEELRQVGPDTVTAGDISARSLQTRGSETMLVPLDRTHVVMETDTYGNAVQWEPKGKVDLSEVERLSDGKYEAPDVSVEKFCMAGPWNTEGTGTFYVDILKGMIGPKFFDQDWINSNKYQPIDVPQEVLDIRIDENGRGYSPTD